LCRIDKSMKVLEIGPSYSPVVRKADGWNAWSIDHLDQDGLRKKYAMDPNVDITCIEHVDFVWTGGSIEEAIPSSHHGTFGACIASHVIEHVPNPVGFYKSMERLVEPSGVLALAVPDKRFCFDYFRPHSVTSEFLLAHKENRQRHFKRAAFDQVAYSVHSDQCGAWGQHPIGNIEFHNTLQVAYQTFEATDDAASAPYVDYHGWCYTPASFQLIMLELNVLGLVDWIVETDFAAAGCEFIVILKRGRATFASEAALQERRRSLLQAIVADIGVQYEYMRGIDPAPSDPLLKKKSPRPRKSRLAKMRSKLVKRVLRPVGLVSDSLRGRGRGD
jgi:hypothetical protein